MGPRCWNAEGPNFSCCDKVAEEPSAGSEGFKSPALIFTRGSLVVKQQPHKLQTVGFDTHPRTHFPFRKRDQASAWRPIDGALRSGTFPASVTQPLFCFFPMALTKYQARVRQAVLVAGDYWSALKRLSYPYWAATARHSESDAVCEYPFWSPVTAVRHAKSGLLGAGEVTCHNSVFKISRQAGARNVWKIPAGLRARLGHQNVN